MTRKNGSALTFVLTIAMAALWVGVIPASWAQSTQGKDYGTRKNACGCFICGTPLYVYFAGRGQRLCRHPCRGCVPGVAVESVARAAGRPSARRSGGRSISRPSRNPAPRSRRTAGPTNRPRRTLRAAARRRCRPPPIPTAMDLATASADRRLRRRKVEFRRRASSISSWEGPSGGKPVTAFTVYLDRAACPLPLAADNPPAEPSAAKHVVRGRITRGDGRVRIEAESNEVGGGAKRGPFVGEANGEGAAVVTSATRAMTRQMNLVCRR